VNVSPPLVEVLAVEKLYQRSGARVVALQDVSFSVAAGSLVAIRGPSGSGKTTLLSLLGCLDAPSSGRIWIAGEDVATLADGAASRLRNRRIGFLFQAFHLIPQMTLLENVETALVYSQRLEREWRERAMGVLAELGLSERAHHRPAEVSGGEAQRAALARALVNDPDLILADEPTGNLDSRTGARVLDLLAATRERGKTVVLVTHDPRTADYAERVLELFDGRLVADHRGAG
jgi:putative ABC transport system ATP-binding protein